MALERPAGYPCHRRGGHQGTLALLLLPPVVAVMVNGPPAAPPAVKAPPGPDRLPAAHALRQPEGRLGRQRVAARIQGDVR